MSDNLSKGPIEVVATDVASINDALRQINDRIDELSGLRGRALIWDRVRVDNPLEAQDALTFGLLPGVTTDPLTDNTGGAADDTVEAVVNYTEKTWSIGSPSGASGTFYFGGFYDFAATDNDFSGGPTFGTANASYAAHFMIVLGAATVDALTIRVTGTSITDLAVRTTSDTEDIVIPNGTAANAFYETSKKWIGQVTITVVSGTAKTCNYGWAKYWDNANTDFTTVGFEATWLGGANDATPDIQLLHHKATGWTFNAGSTPTPPTAIASMATDHDTEIQVVNGEVGAWKRTNLATAISGSGGEGTIIAVVTTANKTFELGNVLMRISAEPENINNNLADIIAKTNLLLAALSG